MESLSETPLRRNRFINSNDSPVFLLKPITLNFDYCKENKEKQHFELFTLKNFEKRKYNEFQMRVEERKKSFNGKEFTIDEAMSKMYGPQAVEANAFLEYYWMTKASCLDAVERGRDFEVENFKNHPLFSPYWLIPLKRDVRWYLLNDFKDKSHKISNGKKENEIRKVSRIPVRVSELDVKTIKNHPISSTCNRIFLRDFKFTGNEKRENRIRSKIPVRITKKLQAMKKERHRM